MAAHHRRTSPQPVLRARRTPHAAHRRGNSLILVTAILVLLVIVAAAFLSRTQAGRQVSSAQQQAIQREERVKPIANMVVDQIAGALFPQPVDPDALPGSPTAAPGFSFRVNPADAGVLTVTTSYPRLATEPNAILFGIDRDFDGDYSPDFGYNAAPYETRAWTNWPDFLSPDFPYGQGQLDGRLFGSNPSTIAIGDSNPLGNPGFNDSRWLRSTEPRRIDVNNDGLPDTFSHWEHLTWLATANNGLRVCTDIGNIFGNNAVGQPNVLTSANEADFTKPFALGMPYEQWLANFPPNPVSSAADFRSRVNTWFGAPGSGASYPSLYASTSALPNLFRLKDLPADVRAEVERTFADTDGDGVTDAFWFVPPISVDRSVRYVVAASVVDNGGLLNVNVATRANPWNTGGLTPSDLALVGNSGSPGESVGFFDNPNNSYEGAGSINSLFTTADANVPSGLYGQAKIKYNPIAFGTADSAVGPTFLKSIGMRFPNGSPNPSLADKEFQTEVNNALVAIGLPPLGPVEARFYSDAERLQYFKSARVGDFGLTPFTIADELELRAFHGQNNPWTTTRFESAISPQGVFDQFLRATPVRSETNEDVFQLTLPGLLKDNRRKVTTVNGARNDLAPPSTWPSAYADPRIDYNGDHFVSDSDGDLVIDPAADPVKVQLDLDAFNRQKFKLDLRQAFTDPLPNGAAPSAIDVRERRLVWRNDIQRMLERSLVRIWFDSATTPPQPKFYQSYLGRQVDAKDLNPNDASNYTPSLSAQRAAAVKTMHMAASLAANIDSYRDGPTAGFGVPTDPPTYPEFGTHVPDWVEPSSPIRYIGQERQPFLMEVYFGLVYPKSRVGVNPPVPPGGSAGNNTLIAELAAKGYPVPATEEAKWKIPQPLPSYGEHFVDSTSVPGVVLAIQLGNPSDLPLNLAGFGVKVKGRTFVFPSSAVIPPTTRERPATAIVFAFAAHVKQNGANPPGESNLDQSEETAVGYYDEDSWRDFLDIQPADLAPGSVVLNASGALLPAPDANGIVVFPPATYANPSDSPFWDTTIELVRVIPKPGSSAAATVVIDRIEDPDNPDPAAIDATFRDAINRLFSDPQRYPPRQNYDITDSDIGRWFMNGVRLKNDDYLVEYARIARPWTWDVPERIPEAGSNVALGASDGVIRPDELNPRYVFAFAGEPRPKKGVDGDLPNLQVQNESDLVADNFQGDAYAFEDSPDGNGSDPGTLWITYDYIDIYGAKERDGIADRLPRRGKPTFFPCITKRQGQNNVYGNGFIFPTTLQDLLPDVQNGVGLELGANVPKGQFDPFTVGDKGMKASDWERIYKPPPPGSPANVIGVTYHDAMMSPFQMNIKDDDFEQIGELLNVFCWGPVLDCSAGYQLPKTIKTFSEILMQEKETEDQPAGRGVFVNRLRITPFQDPAVMFNNLSGYAPTDGPTPILAPPLRPYGSMASTATLFSGVLPAGDIGRVAGRLDMPGLPAGVTIFDAVVCDDRGWRIAATDHDAEVFRQRNAAGFTGEATPGLINLSTALPEVMRALPHATALVNNDSSVHYVSDTGNPLGDFYPQTPEQIDPANNPVTRVVDSIQRYRDKTINEFVSGTIIPPQVGPLNAPFYYDRGVSYASSNGPAMLPSFFWGTVGGGGVPTDGLAFGGLRGDRGIVSIGELLLTQRVAGGTSAAAWNVNQSYSIEFAGLDPYKLGGNGTPNVGAYDRLSTPRLATDRSQGRGSAFLPAAVATASDFPLPRKVFTKVVPDRVGGDAEERNLLFAGMSNLVSVRSDVFTVYLRIKSVKQDPINGRWDATDPALLLDDSRYVMVIDRSNVKKPGEQPRILAFQRVDSPN